MLFDYLKQTRRFLRDPRMQHLDELDLIDYVNRGRREVALRSQSIRRVPPVSGAIVSIPVLAPGSGYQNPTVVISPPDAPSGELPDPGGRQATAIAQQIGGRITNVTVTDGGSGYFNAQASIVDMVTIGPPVFVLGQSDLGGPDVLGAEPPPPQVGAGSGAALAVVTEPLSVTAFQQETYDFANFPIAVFPGIKSVFSVIDVSIIYSNYRYSLPYYPFSVYQAFIRQYPRQYLYVPTMYTQLRQGASGSLLFYPIPNTRYQFEVDCLCLPYDLESDEDYEAIPEPWTDAVPWVAAALCYEELQNLNSARYYRELFDGYSRNYSQWTRGSKTNNIYGRY